MAASTMVSTLASGRSAAAHSNFLCQMALTLALPSACATLSHQGETRTLVDLATVSSVTYPIAMRALYQHVRIESPTEFAKWLAREALLDEDERAGKESDVHPSRLQDKRVEFSCDADNDEDEGLPPLSPSAVLKVTARQQLVSRLRLAKSIRFDSFPSTSVMETLGAVARVLWFEGPLFPNATELMINFATPPEEEIICEYENGQKYSTVQYPEVEEAWRDFGVGVKFAAIIHPKKICFNAAPAGIFFLTLYQAMKRTFELFQHGLHSCSMFVLGCSKLTIFEGGRNELKIVSRIVQGLIQEVADIVGCQERFGAEILGDNGELVPVPPVKLKVVLPPYHAHLLRIAMKTALQRYSRDDTLHIVTQTWVMHYTRTLQEFSCCDVCGDYADQMPARRSFH